MSRLSLRGALVWSVPLLFAFTASVVHAQEQGAEQTPPAGETPADSGAAAAPGAIADSTELVFEREIFNYPAFQRRNPFSPLVGSDGGPRFESMSLGGIIYVQQEPSQSSVLFFAAAGVQESQTSQRLRRGDRWGNVSIVEIRPKEVVVNVEEFGVTEQRIMRMPPQGQGGL